LSHGDSVTQSLPSDIRTEGDAVTLTCTYDTTFSSYTLLWYRQHQGSQPEFILLKDTYGNEHKANFVQDRFSMELQTSKKFTSLTIARFQLSDVAVYYCTFRESTVMISSLTPVQNLP
ncbi:hypothetical protein chiPu_0028691, partial [Chiloscyllium punctatum]|nr:hypothetical protein [Chiloscyllium punctatum]